ncbi:hypothetical protein QR685DRAFT_18434 [Neurospora intermedia]|uniref:Uncharacterized protein n=1 Tax=Neurospora intermedia TaxID=5142 RepID=A0ABR3DPU2_NEUIN
MIETMNFSRTFSDLYTSPLHSFFFSAIYLVWGLWSFGLSYVSFSPFLTGTTLGWCFFPVLFMVKFAAGLLPVTFLPDLPFPCSEPLPVFKDDGADAKFLSNSHAGWLPPAMAVQVRPLDHTGDTCCIDLCSGMR